MTEQTKQDPNATEVVHVDLSVLTACTSMSNLPTGSGIWVEAGTDPLKRHIDWERVFGVRVDGETWPINPAYLRYLQMVDAMSAAADPDDLLERFADRLVVEATDAAEAIAKLAGLSVPAYEDDDGIGCMTITQPPMVDPDHPEFLDN